MPSPNAIIGDSFGTDLPETIVPQEDLSDEKKMARFSKTAEYARLKQHMEERIAFYQSYLPTGEPVTDPIKAGENWVVANTIIGEFKAIMMAYENANEVVNAQQK